MRYWFAALSAAGAAFAPVMAMWPCRINHADRGVLDGMKPGTKLLAPPGRETH